MPTSSHSVSHSSVSPSNIYTHKRSKTKTRVKRKVGKPFSTKMFILLLQMSSSLVAASKQSVVLSRLLAADAHLTRLKGLQGREGNTEALGSHGWSSRL